MKQMQLVVTVLGFFMMLTVSAAAISKDEGAIDWLGFEGNNADYSVLHLATGKGEDGKRCVDELDGTYSAASCVLKNVGEACNNESSEKTRYCQARKCDGDECACGCSIN